MDVFLVPCAPDRYTLYCEKALDSDTTSDATSDRPGWWQRQMRRFREAVDEAEAEQNGQSASVSTGEAPKAKGGIGRWVVRRIAEAVAEQRLLWSLRKESEASLFHPDDVAPARAIELMRQEFTADYAKHRRWCVIDALLAAILGPLFFFVPGPNVVSWYFAFRAVGHFLALRGARQGLDVVVWRTEASSGLRDVRQALGLPADERRAVVEQLSTALGLARLATFVERVSARPS